MGNEISGYCDLCGIYWICFVVYQYIKDKYYKCREMYIKRNEVIIVLGRG